MNNFQEARCVENNYGTNLIEQNAIVDKADVAQRPIVAGGRTYSEEELGYRATCEESYDIMAMVNTIYANYPDARYAI